MLTRISKILGPLIATIVLVASASALAPTDTRDWRWVRGAVFVPTNAVNEAQQWDEYDPAINDRELHYASIYGFNVVRVYLHYYIYLKKKDVLLKDIEDFLTRADKYGIKTEFVFFDDCWNQPTDDMLSPTYHYPAPLPGVHNSRWLVSPGAEVQAHYEEHRVRLKAYVQDIVNAHKNDARICFWEIYNEPNKSAETNRLEKDAAAWIKETGSLIPATATGREYSGDPYCDFKSWHEYGTYDYVGEPSHLNTECMNRQGQSVPGIVSHFAGKTGYILWELGIGRDNCRFAWNENREKPRATEAETPFHGVIYPDGHPWSIDDVKALLGEDKFAATHFFTVKYFSDDQFTHLAKTSVVPFADFDLGNEEGTGSPDATARIPKDDFSVQYDGTVAVDKTGNYKFYVDTDHSASIWIDGKSVVARSASSRGEKSGKIHLEKGRSYSFRAQYVHATGDASLHLSWSGPDLAKQPITPTSVYTKSTID